MKQQGLHRVRPSFLRYIGPGLLVTVGFIDPGNWASNIAAGSAYGYSLLWMVTLSTIILIILQHNAAHLGIATGDCIAESAAKHLRPWLSTTILSTAALATVSTALAEILGAALALNILTGLPIGIGAALTLVVVLALLFTNSYKRIEKLIIGFVSLIGLAFIYELFAVQVDWGQAALSWVVPSIPAGAMPVLMAVLGAVVMPHNLFLHSEVITTREWNLKSPDIIRRQLRYEFLDTLISMLVGWAINSAMIIVAAAVFSRGNIQVTDIAQAQAMLAPVVGSFAAVVFGIALLFSGLAATVTAGMAGGTIVAGMFRRPYDIKDTWTRVGITVILTLATLVIFFLPDTFTGLLYSHIILGIQLPITVGLQLYLTSSRKVMGVWRNAAVDNILLWTIGILVTVLIVILVLGWLGVVNVVV